MTLFHDTLSCLVNTARRAAKRREEKGEHMNKQNKQNEQQNKPTFSDLLRAYEQNASADTLQALAQAVAASVVAKCIDPQRKTAATLESVSNGGQSPALIALRREIQADTAAVASLARNASAAYQTAINADGDICAVVADKDAARAVDKLASERLGDGMDLVQEAALAILEQESEHGGAAMWTEQPYTVKRLNKRVIIKREDSAAWHDESTTPIQEVFRAVRRKVDESGQVRAASGRYAYIAEQVGEDGEEQVYRRLALYSDLGGAPHNGTFHMDGAPAEYGGGELYTVGADTVTGYYALLERLDLTHRQEQILRLREKGYGTRAIATYLGVTQATVCRTMQRLQERCAAVGIVPNK